MPKLIIVTLDVEKRIPEREEDTVLPMEKVGKTGSHGEVDVIHLDRHGFQMNAPTPNRGEQFKDILLLGVRVASPLT